MNVLKLIEKTCEDEKHLIKDLTFAFKASLYQKMIVPDSLEFDNTIADLRVLSKEAKTELLSKEIETLKNTDITQFITKMLFISHHFLFFADQEIKDRFKSLGLPNTVTRWYIPIQKIKDEFDKINESESIQMLPTKWIYFIHQHLFMNLIDEYYTWAGKTGKKRSGTYYNDLHNNLYNLIRAKNNYKNVNNYLRSYNFKMQTLPILDELIKHTSTAEARKTVLQSSQGKTEKIALAFAFNECSFLFAHGQQPYCDSWGLFKLLMPNRNLMDKETFELSDQFETYERNYKRYCYYSLKKVILLGNSD